MTPLAKRTRPHICVNCQLQPFWLYFEEGALSSGLPVGEKCCQQLQITFISTKPVLRNCATVLTNPPFFLNLFWFSIVSHLPKTNFLLFLHLKLCLLSLLLHLYSDCYFLAKVLASETNVIQNTESHNFDT